ncbi:MAG: BofC C-terminal domain-containing protein [Clostridia bacterium]
MYRVQKKKRGGLFFLVLFLCAFAVGLGIGYGGIKMNLWRQEAEAVPDSVPSVPSAAPGAETAAPGRPASLSVVVPEETAPPQPQYFVISKDGAVCVFTLDEKGEQRFSHKLSIELEALRKSDQKLFEEGIYLYSKQELLELTEDFAS